jgi:hypothetical protein
VLHRVSSFAERDPQRKSDKVCQNSESVVNLRYAPSVLRMISQTLSRHNSFFFEGQTYRYLSSLRNGAWATERAVEVPVIWREVRKNRPADVLEVGNVLSNYHRIYHQVVDKYEPSIGVINKDIVDFRPNRTYDLIVSISTLEHVGFEEEVKEPRKPLRAVENIRSLLSQSGKAIFTVPIGWNPTIDTLLLDGELFDDQKYLGRIGRNNEWEEVDRNKALLSKYGSLYPFANAICVGKIRAKAKSRST